MSRDIDQRDFSVSRASSQRLEELRGQTATVAAQAGLVGVALPPVTVVKLDPTTGNPAVLSFEPRPPEGGLEGQTDLGFVQRALDVVQTVGPVLGLAPGQPAEFTPDRHIQKSSSGARAVHLHQLYKGIPVFQAAEAVRFAPDGGLRTVVGRSITVGQDVDPVPVLPVERAVLLAARFVSAPGPDEQGVVDQFGERHQPPSVDLRDGAGAEFVPRVLARFDSKPEKLTLLDQGPFADLISASLAWFPRPDESLRLAWQVYLTLPGYTAAFQTLVDATTEDILYSHQLVNALRGRANVHTSNGDDTRQMVDLPLPLNIYGLPVRPGDLPQGFPRDWLDDARTTSNGTVAFAHLGDDPNRMLQGVLQNNTLVFSPADSLGDEQKVLNIFYYVCLMHDFFYLLGFREEGGNFQEGNFGLGGAASDPVDARAYSGPVPMTANMFTPPDGTSPIMKMGLVTTTGRHTAFDSTVVFHEYTHGVTNRLVGGPLNVNALTAPQCRGMGEGWGDYIACTTTGSSVIGAWTVNNPGGVRQFRYDASFPSQTENFSMLGKGRYTEEHNVGEIWCATLLEINRNIGDTRALQLVIDALKLSPANPSFLDMRDAILAALDFERDAANAGPNPMSATDYASARLGIWKAFAKFGMGPAAACNGAFLAGIVADFTLPADGVAPPSTTGSTPPGTQSAIRGEVSPALPIPDNDPAGIESHIAITQQGLARLIRVAVDITHPVPEDLVVQLVAPSGQRAVLHDRAPRPQPDLVATLDSTTNQALTALLGQQLQGNWTLRVADTQRKDVGTLNKWSIELEPAADGTGAGLTDGTPPAHEAAQTSTLEVRLQFPNERSKEDFRIAFTSWVQQYQQLAGALDAFEKSFNEARGFTAQGLSTSRVPWDRTPYYMNFIANW